MEPVNERELVERCRRGDEGAFQELVDGYKNLVYALIARTVQDRTRAEARALVSPRDFRSRRGGGLTGPRRALTERKAPTSSRASWAEAASRDLPAFDTSVTKGDRLRLTRDLGEGYSWHVWSAQESSGWSFSG